MSKPMNDFIIQSWAIEGYVFNTLAEDRRREIIQAHNQLLLTYLSVESLVQFVQVVSGGLPRFMKGLDVTVAGHRPIAGGEQVRVAILALIDRIKGDKRSRRIAGFDYYWQYLHLHPFTDGNGRSARALWLKIAGYPQENKSFLEEFHYQSLMWQDAQRAADVKYMLPVEEDVEIPNEDD